MWKVFAIVCILVQDPMGIERQDCQLFHEAKDNRFETEELCIIQAEQKKCFMDLPHTIFLFNLCNLAVIKKARHKKISTHLTYNSTS